MNHHQRTGVTSETASSMRVLVIEDKTESWIWLQQLVKLVWPGVTCGWAASLTEARELLCQQQWQLLLVDIGLPDGSGITLIKEIQQAPHPVPTIVTTIFDDDNNVFQALASGAQGYLLKSDPESELMGQLQRFKSGQPPISAPIARRMLHFFREPRKGVDPLNDNSDDSVLLTPRETDILEGIGKGLRTREVAQGLGLSEQTVATYVRNLYAKLNIHTRSQATLEAVRRGLL